MPGGPAGRHQPRKRLPLSSSYSSFWEGGKRDVKGGAAVGVVGSPYLARVRRDDGAANGQTEPRALGLRRVKRLEDSFDLPRGNTAAGIGNGEHDVSEVVEASTNAQSPIRGCRVRHCIGCI